MPTGLALSVGLGRVPARPSPYAVETRRVLDRWQTLEVGASDARAAIVDTLVRALVAATALSDFDGLYLPMAHARAAGRVNLVTPGIHDLTEVDAANLSFVEDRGFAGNGSSSYLDTGINPSLGGFKFAQNDAALLVWSLTDSNDGSADIGSGALTRVLARSGGNLVTRGNAGTTGSAAVADSLGLAGWSRDAADHYDLIKGASVLTPPIAVASSGINNATIRVGAASTVYSTCRLALASVGRAVAAKVAAVHAAMGAYAAAVGA